MNFRISGQKINMISETKYLGTLILDEYLTNITYTNITLNSKEQEPDPLKLPPTDQSYLPHFTVAQLINFTQLAMAIASYLA